ncbi:dienelactone hydrolase family protein [Actinoplanes flavus]|uniref:Alpha/beta hydrolase n=1 Tax=Actinoplanes flavus TaxID=2820290 RepID=A0ABS3UT47_9ACTN|nr:alpha/beta hydrolase [Actinoplanes flavus]MBO3741732.1 alpha/beta hydrolase [Actinoplanes flavus]
MRSFTVGGVPAVLWSPGATDRPLIFIGHGGGEHKTAPEILRYAERFTAAGFAVVSADVPNHGDRPYDPGLDRKAGAMRARVDAGENLAVAIAAFQDEVSRQTVGEWRAVLDHLGADRAGYWGVSLGCGLGVPFVAAEPRVRAAVLGLGGGSANAATAARISVPVRFVIAWDDERIPRDNSLTLFDALGTPEKSLHAHPGGHSGPLPDHELDAQVAFFGRHLSPHPQG